MNESRAAFFAVPQTLLHCHAHAGLVIGAGDIPGGGLGLLTAVGHGKGTPRPAEHLQVIARVAEGHHLLRPDAQPGAQSLHCRPLVDAGGGKLHIALEGVGDRQRAPGQRLPLQLLPPLRRDVKDVDLFHSPRRKGLVQPLRKLGTALQDPPEPGAEGVLQHLLPLVQLDIVLAPAVDLHRQAPVQQQLDELHPALVGHTVFVQPLSGGHVQHRRAVGEHRVPGDPQLLMYLPQQIPGPAAGDGHRRPPLRRRPESGHVALGHRGVVLVQQGAVHVQANQSNIVHFFSFRAWRTLSAIPSGVRP